MLRASAESLCTDWLREQIMSGALKPGERIRPEAIALQLGVSRMPVREALRLLDAEGLIILRANRGAIVTRLDADDMAEVYEMRAMMEGLCARHAALRVTDADIDALDSDAQALRLVMHDPLRWAARHSAFHEKICELSGLARAAAEARRLRIMLAPSVRMYTGLRLAPEVVGHEHDVIVDALRSGDPLQCEAVIIAHIRANAKNVLGRAAAAPRWQATTTPPG